jgi:hypothetical protein
MQPAAERDIVHTILEWADVTESCCGLTPRERALRERLRKWLAARQRGHEQYFVR